MKMNFFKLLIMLGMFGNYITNDDIGGSEVEETQDPDAQKILDNIAEGKSEFEEAEEDEKINLPSDDDGEEEDPDSEEDSDDKLLAGKYKNTDELRKGIVNLKSTLPEYVLNGMSDEALVQHYTELEKSFSGGKKHIIKDDSEEKIEAKKDVEKKSDKPDEAKAIPQDVWEELSTSFNEKGGLSEAQYDKLESFGIPTEIVDGYLDGLVAKQQSFTNSIHSIAGGEAQYNVIKEWAMKNIDQAYLASLDGMPEAQAKSAMMGIKAQYDLANEKPIKRIVGGNKGSGGNSSSYSSQEAYFRDVQDNRYNTDEAFRKKVDSKLKNSKF